MRFVSGLRLRFRAPLRRGSTFMSRLLRERTRLHATALRLSIALCSTTLILLMSARPTQPVAPVLGCRPRRPEAAGAVQQLKDQRRLPAPTRVSPAPTTEYEQHQKNDQHTLYASSPPTTWNAYRRIIRMQVLMLVGSAHAWLLMREHLISFERGRPAPRSLQTPGSGSRPGMTQCSRSHLAARTTDDLTTGQRLGRATTRAVQILENRYRSSAASDGPAESIVIATLGPSLYACSHSALLLLSA